MRKTFRKVHIFLIFIYLILIYPLLELIPRPNKYTFQNWLYYVDILKKGIKKIFSILFIPFQIIIFLIVFFVIKNPQRKAQGRQVINKFFKRHVQLKQFMSFQDSENILIKFLEKIYDKEQQIDCIQYYKEKKYGKAITALSSSYNNEPKNNMVYLLLSKAIIYLQWNKKEKFQNTLTEISDYEKYLPYEDLKFYINLRLINNTVHHHHDQDQQLFDRMSLIIKDDQEKLEHLTSCFKLYLRLEKYDSALKYLDSSIQLAPKTDSDVTDWLKIHKCHLLVAINSDKKSKEIKILIDSLKSKVEKEFGGIFIKSFFWIHQGKFNKGFKLFATLNPPLNTKELDIYIDKIIKPYYLVNQSKHILLQFLAVWLLYKSWKWESDFWNDPKSAFATDFEIEKIYYPLKVDICTKNYLFDEERKKLIKLIIKWLPDYFSFTFNEWFSHLLRGEEIKPKSNFSEIIKERENANGIELYDNLDDIYKKRPDRFAVLLSILYNLAKLDKDRELIIELYLYYGKFFSYYCYDSPIRPPMTFFNSYKKAISTYERALKDIIRYRLKIDTLFQIQLHWQLANRHIAFAAIYNIKTAVYHYNIALDLLERSQYYLFPQVSFLIYLQLANAYYDLSDINNHRKCILKLEELLPKLHRNRELNSILLEREKIKSLIAIGRYINAINKCKEINKKIAEIKNNNYRILLQIFFKALEYIAYGRLALINKANRCYNERKILYEKNRPRFQNIPKIENGFKTLAQLNDFHFEELRIIGAFINRRGNELSKESNKIWLTLKHGNILDLEKFSKRRFGEHWGLKYGQYIEHITIRAFMYLEQGEYYDLKTTVGSFLRHNEENIPDNLVFTLFGLYAKADLKLYFEKQTTKNQPIFRFHSKPEIIYKNIRKAYTTLDNFISKINIEGYKSKYLEDKRFIFDTLIDLCYIRNKQQMRFWFADKFKNPSLVDHLMNFDFGRGIYTLQLQELKDEMDITANNIYKGIEQEINQVVMNQLEDEFEDIIETRLVSQRQQRPKQTLKNLQNLLKEDEALICYFYSEDNLYIDVVTKHQKYLTVRYSPRIDKEIKEWVDQFIHSIISNDVDVKIQRKLSDLLISPLQSYLPNLKKIYIIPDKMLFKLPYHLLDFNHSYFCEKFIIKYLPNLLYFSTSRAKTKHNNSKLLAIGNPTGDLIGAENEVKEIKNTFPKSTIFLQNMATYENVVTAISNNDILHFACHGFFREDKPMFSYLLLANGERMTVYDFMNLEITSNLVVLNSCQSGETDISAGNEMFGLTRAFLAKGTKHIITNLWEIDDKVSYSLMKGFYEYLSRGNSIEESFNKMQTRGIKKFKSPKDWGSIVHIGA